jgi:signal transduction histidine kinase
VRTRTSVAVDTSAVSGAPMSGRPDDLRRLVGNLLDNAVRHADSHVWVSVSTCDGRVRLEVTDDGPGVPPADRDRVFERFHRADVSRDRGSGGTGLGLPISRTVAEQHGGELVLADDAPGAHFVATFPALQAGFSSGGGQWEHTPEQTRT